MTATLSQQVTRVGSTKPRIYTPPLPEHLDALGWMARDWSGAYERRRGLVMSMPSF